MRGTVVQRAHPCHTETCYWKAPTCLFSQCVGPHGGRPAIHSGPWAKASETRTRLRKDRKFTGAVQGAPGCLWVPSAAEACCWITQADVLTRTGLNMGNLYPAIYREYSFKICSLFPGAPAGVNLKGNFVSPHERTLMEVEFEYFHSVVLVIFLLPPLQT